MPCTQFIRDQRSPVWGPQRYLGELPPAACLCLFRFPGVISVQGTMGYPRELRPNSVDALLILGLNS